MVLLEKLRDRANLNGKWKKFKLFRIPKVSTRNNYEQMVK